MQHFPIFVSLAEREVVVSGGGDVALSKLRLLLKTPARITVLATDPAPEIAAWAAAGRLRLLRRELRPGDAAGAVLFYAAAGDADRDARAAALARADGSLVNIVDNLADSNFITPAIVDRDPVVVAIGTEGAAPVLARAIKTDLEARLPVSLGRLARIGKAFRRAAEALAPGRARRDFWSAFYFDTGPRAIATGDAAVRPALERLLQRHRLGKARPGHVAFVGAGPGDPDLLTLAARRALDTADVVIHDRLVGPDILELARREATIIEMGKTAYGPSSPQEAINALIVEHARGGARVVRLKSGDATLFGRLDEEIEACEAAGVDWHIIPGITAASAAAAAIGQSLTRRGRNSSVRFLTGHDMAGFAEHDWVSLARSGAVAAIYMGRKSARFVQGRLLMHGADRATPATVIENVSRPDQRVLASTIGRLPGDLESAGITGPALIFLGLAPRAAMQTISDAEKELA